MEVLFNALKIAILLAIVASSWFVIIILRKLKWKLHFLSFLLLGMLLSFFLTALLGWWSDFSNDLLLCNYGYDFEAMNAIDRIANVPEADLDKVKSLERNRMGMGWPVKVLFTYVFGSPVLLILYIGVFYFRKAKTRKCLQSNK